jgi:CBS domain containing-hemolysin-like protein
MVCLIVIVGTLRVKDLAHRYITRADGPGPLMRPVVRQQDLRRIAVTVLREKRAHQAVVVDAADRPVGLITIQNPLAPRAPER